MRPQLIEVTRHTVADFPKAILIQDDNEEDNIPNADYWAVWERERIVSDPHEGMVEGFNRLLRAISAGREAKKVDWQSEGF